MQSTLWIRWIEHLPTSSQHIELTDCPAQQQRKQTRRDIMKQFPQHNSIEFTEMVPIRDQLPNRRRNVQAIGFEDTRHLAELMTQAINERGSQIPLFTKVRHQCPYVYLFTADGSTEYNSRHKMRWNAIIDTTRESKYFFFGNVRYDAVVFTHFVVSYVFGE